MSDEMRELLRDLADSLNEQADVQRERARVADKQRDGSVPTEEVDRWVASFATSYQTLRAISLAIHIALGKSA